MVDSYDFSDLKQDKVSLDTNLNWYTAYTFPNLEKKTQIFPHPLDFLEFKSDNFIVTLSSREILKSIIIINEEAPSLENILFTYNLRVR